MHALFDKISLKAKTDPFALAIINPELQFSYQELHTLILLGQKLLDKHNIAQGDRVGLLFEKPIHHFLASLVLLYRGCTLIPFHNSTSELQLTSFTQLTHCQYLLSDYKKLLNVTNAIPFSNIELRNYSIDAGEKLTSNPVQAEQVAILIIGSGTTNNSKIIPVSYFSLLKQLERDIDAHQLREDERFLALSPISYYTSLRRMLACLLTSACAAFINVNKDNLLQFCNRTKIDHLSIVHAHAQILFPSLITEDKDQIRLPYLKTLFIGASPISQNMRGFLKSKFTPNVYIFYGPNEVGPATCAHLNNTGNKEGSIGLPIKGITIEIVDDNDKPCNIGKTGRMRIKAEGVCQHYEETGDTLSKESFKDFWFYPKDLAYFDEDGHIIFQGREDDLIIYNGNNIYPRQIEEVLEQHPLVQEVAALGLLNKNKEQFPIAIVTLKDKSKKSSKTKKDLYTYCQEQLHWSAPAFIDILDELPKNDAGKILKRELKQSYQSRSSL